MSNRYTKRIYHVTAIIYDVLERLQRIFCVQRATVASVTRRRNGINVTRPVLHIFRGATIGSLTRHGRRDREHPAKVPLTGIILRGSEIKLCIRMDVGATVRAGKGPVMQGESMALVGSMLDNGDEIISTPQGCQMFVFREGDAPGWLLTVPGESTDGAGRLFSFRGDRTVCGGKIITSAEDFFEAITGAGKR